MVSNIFTIKESIFVGISGGTAFGDSGGSVLNSFISEFSGDATILFRISMTNAGRILRISSIFARGDGFAGREVYMELNRSNNVFPGDPTDDNIASMVSNNKWYLNTISNSGI